MKSDLSLFKLFVISVSSLCSSVFIATESRAASFDSNVPSDVKQQMIDDLEFIKSIQGLKTSKLHKDIFGAMDGQNYYNWFDVRVKSIGLNSCGGGNAVACVYPMIPNKMFITQNYIKFSHPQISRLMVVYHEARHTERQNGNWGHATCPRPFLDENGQPMRSIWTGASLAGEPACDVTPLGSYGSSTILLKNISLQCSSCNEKVKQDAALYANDQLGRVINPNAKQQMLADFASITDGLNVRAKERF